MLELALRICLDPDPGPAGAGVRADRPAAGRGEADPDPRAGVPAAGAAADRRRDGDRRDRGSAAASAAVGQFRTRKYTARMAVVQKTTPLDAERLRADFPIFERPVHGDKRLVYLDSANSSQKPRQVIDKLVEVYETSYANVHRGVYQLAVAATEQLEGARDKVAGFINAPSRHEVIFVRQATEGLNLVAYAYGRKFIKAGDAIVTTEMEHHSNLVPWQFLAQQTGATLHYLRLTDDGELDPASLERLNDVENIKLLAVTEVVELAGHAQRRPGAGRVGARARRGAGGGRRPGGAPPAGRRPGAGLRLLRHLRPQDVRPGIRRAVGAHRGARDDGSVPDRRRDDPHCRPRPDDVERAAVEVRGGHPLDRREHRPGRRRRLPDVGRHGRDPGAREGADRLRPRPAVRDPRRRPVRAGPGAPRRHPQLQRWRASTRTTSPRSWTPTASASAPATIARSR